MAETASVRSDLGFPIEVSAVAFDLDGTLADTAPDLHTSANLMLGDLGYAPTDRETVREYIGQGIDRLVERLLADDAGSTPESRRRAGDIFRTHYREHLVEDSCLFPGTADTLHRLREAGVKLACVTNKSEAFTRPLLDGLEVLDLFDEIIGGDTLARRKPDPLPLTWCAERFGIEPSHLLMVGDSQTDTLCARAAGCPVVCVPFGYRSGMALHELDCDAIVPSASNLFELIRLPRA